MCFCGSLFQYTVWYFDTFFFVNMFSLFSRACKFKNWGCIYNPNINWIPYIIACRGSRCMWHLNNTPFQLKFDYKEKGYIGLGIGIWSFVEPLLLTFKLPAACLCESFKFAVILLPWHSFMPIFICIYCGIHFRDYHSHALCWWQLEIWKLMTTSLHGCCTESVPYCLMSATPYSNASC